MNIYGKKSKRAFTIVEVLMAASITTVTVGLTLGLFVSSLKVMCKDAQRLQTNASLRYITAQIATETIDASEFYIFPTLQNLDGSVDLSTAATSDLAKADSINTDQFYGDCLVLVTRVTDTSANSNVRQFKIYYRNVTSSDSDGALRYYSSQDWGATSGTTTSLTALLNAVNLKNTPIFPGSKQLAASAHGRVRPTVVGSPVHYYPIFSADCPYSSVAGTNESVSINVEVVNGYASNNLMSSSSFNYTISPRR